MTFTLKNIPCLWNTSSPILSIILTIAPPVNLYYDATFTTCDRTLREQTPKATIPRRAFLYLNQTHCLSTRWTDRDRGPFLHCISTSGSCSNLVCPFREMGHHSHTISYTMVSQATSRISSTAWDTSKTTGDGHSICSGEYTHDQDFPLHFRPDSPIISPATNSSRWFHWFYRLRFDLQQVFRPMIRRSINVSNKLKLRLDFPYVFSERTGFPEIELW